MKKFEKVMLGRDGDTWVAIGVADGTYEVVAEFEAQCVEFASSLPTEVDGLWPIDNAATRVMVSGDRPLTPDEQRMVVEIADAAIRETRGDKAREC